MDLPYSNLVTQDLLIYHELFHFYYHLKPNKGKKINVLYFAGIQTRHVGSERECCNQWLHFGKDGTRPKEKEKEKEKEEEEEEEEPVKVRGSGRRAFEWLSLKARSNEPTNAAQTGISCWDQK